MSVNKFLIYFFLISTCFSVFNFMHLYYFRENHLILEYNKVLFIQSCFLRRSSINTFQWPKYSFNVVNNILNCIRSNKFLSVSFDKM